LIERVTNRTRYAVDVTSGGRSSAMSRKDVGDDLCHLEPLPRFDFRPVIANGSFTSILLKNSEIEGRRKSRFRAHSVL
jgi:hypothetical protein